MPLASPCMLMQFEAIFLTEIQIRRFQSLYKERKFDEPNPVFQSWLPLKLTTQPTEAEAFQAVLCARTPTVAPLQTKKRAGRKVPNGAARFNPISPEWNTIMEENQDRETDRIEKGKGKGKEKGKGKGKGKKTLE